MNKKLLCNELIIYRKDILKLKPDEISCVSVTKIYPKRKTMLITSKDELVTYIPRKNRKEDLKKVKKMLKLLKHYVRKDMMHKLQVIKYEHQYQKETMNVIELHLVITSKDEETFLCRFIILIDMINEIRKKPLTIAEEHWFNISATEKEDEKC